MSNIGKLPIVIPENTKIIKRQYKNFQQFIFNFNNKSKYINIPNHFKLKILNNKLFISCLKKDSFYGTLNKKIQHILTDQFTRQISLIGIGYKLEIKGNKIHSDIGYSHPLIYEIPSNISIKEIKNNVLEAKSDSLEDLMSFLSKIWIVKKSEKDKYKNKGYKISLN